MKENDLEGNEERRRETIVNAEGHERVEFEPRDEQEQGQCARRPSAAAGHVAPAIPCHCPEILVMHNVERFSLSDCASGPMCQSLLENRCKMVGDFLGRAAYLLARISTAGTLAGVLVSVNRSSLSGREMDCTEQAALSIFVWVCLFAHNPNYQRDPCGSNV